MRRKVNYSNRSNDAMTLLDFIQGDVNGDRIKDNIYLYGNKTGGADIYAEDITLFIQDGATKQTAKIALAYNAGYNARLFLGDFTGDGIADIKIDIDSGGSGGYVYSYVYSYKNNEAKLIFDFDKYNATYEYRADYADCYKVDVSSKALDVLMVLDISGKDPEYLSELYNEDGKLKKPFAGDVSALVGLVSVAKNEKGNGFDLLAIQRVIGKFNADTLGYVANLLSRNGTEFTLNRAFSATDAMKLTNP